MINVGANKGYDVRDLYARYGGGQIPSGEQWLKELKRNNVTEQPCGACGACGNRITRTAGRRGVETVVAAEAEPQNAAVLRRIFAKFNLSARGAEVLHAVVGDGADPGVADVAVAKNVGDERGGVVRDAAAGAVVAVPTTTIDRIVRERRLRVVDWCIIDAEGYDHAILRGAVESIRARRLRVIAFEYGDQWCKPGPQGWCEPLQPTIAFLAAHKYRCWWLGNRGRLAPVSASCPDISTRRWSNIACVSEGRLVRAMRSLSRLNMTT